jgi:16S rRNA (guanine966-N2)-methyltransferase
VRIIAGQFRGRKIKSPPSLETRPTSDRLRETLFNILAPRIEGARFLDLCAGSGAVGLEAISRGAGHVTFVDNSRRMVNLIQANLDLCRVGDDEFLTVMMEATEFLRRRLKRVIEPWDLVFFDPPYAEDYQSVLQLFGDTSSERLAENAWLVVEHHQKNDLPEVVAGLHRFRVLKQGDSALSFYKSAPEAAAGPADEL